MLGQSDRKGGLKVTDLAFVPLFFEQDVLVKPLLELLVGQREIKGAAIVRCCSPDPNIIRSRERAGGLEHE